MGFYSGTTPALRVLFYGFCGALAAFLLRSLGYYFDFGPLNILAVVVMLVSIGVAAWGIVFAPHGSVDGHTPNRRLAFVGFCGVVASGLVRQVADRNGASFLGVVGVVIGLASVVLILRALFFAKS